MFLAHYVGGGIDSVLDLDSEDYFMYLESAMKFYKIDFERPMRVIVSGFEKR